MFIVKTRGSTVISYLGNICFGKVEFMLLVDMCTVAIESLDSLSKVRGSFCAILMAIFQTNCKDTS